MLRRSSGTGELPFEGSRGGRFPMLLPRPRFRTAIVWTLLGRIAERHRRPVQTSQAGPASQPDQLLTRGETPPDVHRDAIHRAVYGAADLLGLAYRSNASVVDCRRSSSASCDCCRPATICWRFTGPGRYRPFASAAVFNPGPAYRIGRLKIRMARTVNSVLASSTALSQISYFSSYVRQRIHFGFVGGVSQLLQPSPPSWRFSIAARLWRRPKRSSR
jgi:hypothetical protein